jgi:hypothetical protein
MNVKACALATGILWGFLLFIVTLIDTALGRGSHLALLRGLFPGYAVTYLGSVIGLIYGFVGGAILGGVFCWLYNRFACAPATPKT